jgi:hypothetical protein
MTLRRIMLLFLIIHFNASLAKCHRHCLQFTLPKLKPLIRIDVEEYAFQFP